MKRLSHLRPEENPLETGFLMNKTRLFSRKNEVFLEESESILVIRKRFRKSSSFLKERDYLSYLKEKIEVPSILSEYIERQELILQFLDGPPIIQLDTREFLIAVSMASIWLRKLHFLGVVKGDCNPRNFIMHRGKIYGIDFEEASLLIDGSYDPIKDLVDLISTTAVTLYTRGLHPLKSLELSLGHVLESYGAHPLPEINYKELIKNFLRDRKKFRPERSHIFDALIEETKNIEIL